MCTDSPSNLYTLKVNIAWTLGMGALEPNGHDFHQNIMFA